MQKVISREQLMNMPLHLFKGLDIVTPEQEALVQEVLNLRTANITPTTKVYTGDVPMEIKTPEEEAYWQKILDERRAEIRARSQVAHPMITEVHEQELTEELSVLEAQKEVLEKELAVSVPLCQYCDTKSKMKHKKVCINYK